MHLQETNTVAKISCGVFDRRNISSIQYVKKYIWPIHVDMLYLSCFSFTVSNRLYFALFLYGHDGGGKFKDWKPNGQKLSEILFCLICICLSLNIL